MWTSMSVISMDVEILCVVKFMYLYGVLFVSGEVTLFEFSSHLNVFGLISIERTLFHYYFLFIIQFYHFLRIFVVFCQFYS